MIPLPITDPTWIFFIVLSIILIAPMILERLRVPAIVGMIAAGVLIGPHGFNILARDSSFELFGKVGLYYIMFLAALEMNLQDLWKIRYKALVFGLLSFIIPIALGFGANTLILGASVVAGVLMSAMYASHTLVSYPIILRYGLSRRESVNLAVGSTIVADTLTLLMLAVVGGSFKEAPSDFFLLWLVLKTIAIGATIVFLFPMVARLFFRRFNDGVIQYIFVLSLVFLGAGLMEFVGMEGILGAFLAGLALNKHIPATSPLMTHIEFVGNALFIPYFLIGVGMIVNVGALKSIEAVKIALVMIIVSTLGKWLAARVVRRVYHLHKTEGALLFGLTNARAAATLAIVIVGYEIHLPDGSRLLNEQVLNGTMLLILVSCLISSLVTERSARKLALDTEEAPARPDTVQPHMLIALSNPTTVEPLINMALLLRSTQKRTLITAVNIIRDDKPNAHETGLQLLEKAAQIAASANVHVQTRSRWSVNIVSGLSHSMKEADANALMIGLHHKAHLFEKFFGRLATDLFRAVDKQIIVYRPLSSPNTIRHLQLFVPDNAEYEPGFAEWAAHIAQLAGQLSCRINVHAGKHTQRALKIFWTKQRYSLQATYNEYTDWDNFLPLAIQTRESHLAVFIIARPGTLSYQNYFARMPEQLERHFTARNLMIILPAQYRGTYGREDTLPPA